MTKITHLLQTLNGCINRDHYLLTNEDGSHMDRKDIANYLGVSYGYGCSLVRKMIDQRALAQFSVGPHTKFAANPFMVDANPTPDQTLVSIFKLEVATFE